MCEKTEVRFKWTCPHCGFENRGFAVAKDTYGGCEPQFAYCDIESGGCDRMVAIKPRLVVEATVYKLESAEPVRYSELDSALDAAERKAEADEEMADHLDNRRRAREQMDGLRRGMGLDTEAEAEARTDYYYPLS